MSYHQQRKKQTRLPGHVAVKKGKAYDRVLLDGKVVASRNNKSGKVNGTSEFVKYLPDSDLSEHVYILDRLPHPQSEHLASRIRGMGGKLFNYEQFPQCSRVIVIGNAKVAKEVEDYFKERNVHAEKQQ